MFRFDRQLMGIPIICLALAGLITVATPPTVRAVPLPGFTVKPIFRIRDCEL